MEAANTKITIYIEEKDFRDCNLNCLSEPPPFTNAKNGTIKPEYFHEPVHILKRLAIDDTFHDLSQSRGPYNCKTFNEDGPLGYLLTGIYDKTHGPNVFNKCKDKINLPVFSSIKDKRFESFSNLNIEPYEYDVYSKIIDKIRKKELDFTEQDKINILKLIKILQFECDEYEIKMLEKIQQIIGI